MQEYRFSALSSKSGRLTEGGGQGHRPPSSKPQIWTSAPKRPIVYLTSFWRARGLDVRTFYIANSQPEGFTYEKLELFQPIVGRWVLRERNKDFKERYEEMLRSKAREIVMWVEGIDDDLALTCWCKDNPYRLSRCTRILVARLLERIRPDLDIRLDMQNPAWRT